MRSEINEFLSQYCDPLTEGYENFVDFVCLNSYFLVVYHIYCIVKNYEVLGERFKFLTDCLKIGNYPLGLYGEEKNIFLILTR